MMRPALGKIHDDFLRRDRVPILKPQHPLVHVLARLARQRVGRHISGRQPRRAEENHVLVAEVFGLGELNRDDIAQLQLFRGAVGMQRPGALDATLESSS